MSNTKSLVVFLIALFLLLSTSSVGAITSPIADPYGFQSIGRTGDGALLYLVNKGPHAPTIVDGTATADVGVIVGVATLYMRVVISCREKLVKAVFLSARKSPTDPVQLLSTDPTRELQQAEHVRFDSGSLAGAVAAHICRRVNYPNR